MANAPTIHFLLGGHECIYINCFKVGDAILQALVITSGYVSYCCLSMVSNQSDQVSLTPDINTFFCTQLPLTGYFLLLRTDFCKNPGGACASMKIPVDQKHFDKRSEQRAIWHQQPCHVQSHFLILALNYSKLPLPRPHASMQWVAAMWLADRRDILTVNWTLFLIMWPVGGMLQ